MVNTLPQCSSHASDAGLRCQTGCVSGGLRLVGGNRHTEGRVEVCVSQVWGTVCDDDSWDDTDAAVVCRQAGFSRFNAVGMRSSGGTGPIHLNNVGCIGTEESLLQCPSSSSTGHCTHTQDAGVVCSAEVMSSPTSVIVQGIENSLNVSWSAPREHFSSLTGYRVTCTSADQQQSQVGGDASAGINTVVIFSLPFHTQYSCCVEVSHMDASENASTCATGATEEGVPGEPVGLIAMPSQTDCTTVLLQWSPPAAEQQNGVILGYNVTVMNGSSVVQSLSSAAESYIVGSLRCCSDYSYRVAARTAAGEGMPSQAMSFRTKAQFDDVYRVRTDTGADSISINWRTSSLILQQQLRTVTVTLTPDCPTDNMAAQAMTFTLSPDEGNSVIASGLDAFVPYIVHVSALICENTFELYNETVIIHRDNEVGVPAVEGIIRDSPSTATFDISIDSSTNNIFEIAYFINVGTSFDENNPVGVFRTDQSRTTIEDLSLCISYWVVVTALNCINQVSSSPQLIGLFEPVHFSFLIFIGDNTPCRTWVVNDFARKISDVQNSLSTAVESMCGMPIPCVANSQFTCGTDSGMANFEALLVSTDSLSSSQQLECLNKWVDSTTQINIAGVPLRITAPAVTPTDNSTPENEAPGIPVYVWPVIAIAIVALIIALVLAVVIFSMKRKKKHTWRTLQDEFHGGIENPVFSDTVDPFAESHEKEEEESKEEGVTL